MKNPLNRFARNSLCAAAAALAVTTLPPAARALVRPEMPMPATRDVRGADGMPLGPVLKPLTEAQTRALKALQLKVGAPLTVQYNGLTGTPRNLFVAGGALTRRSPDAPELIAQRFLHDNRGLYRFSDEDLDGLRLRTRSTVPGIETTVMVFEQQVGGVPVYQGDVLVNVSKAGEIISVGNDNYPQLSITNRRTLSAAQAVTQAAAGLGASGYSPTSVGLKPVLTTYGQLPAEYVQAESFAADRQFGDEIHVTPVVFPVGATARQAWKVNLTDMAHYGAMWESVVDAETGEVLARICLTAFDAPPGQQGGGVGTGRRASFRPDVQDMVENFNTPQSAYGKIFDTAPTILAGYKGYGRSKRTGDAPANYQYAQPTWVDPKTTTNNTQAADGRGSKYFQLAMRNENGLPFADSNSGAKETFNYVELPSKLGEVQRGFPDAANPSAGSPFGWFYLPTLSGGAEVKVATAGYATTQAFGYTMAAEGVTRNKVFGTNGPTSDGTQPFAANVTPLASAVTLPDGRVLSSVYQSNYTEGNNAIVSDDRANDNDSTRGIRGYSANRQFSSPYFTYRTAYEYGGTDATSVAVVTTVPMTVVIPATVDPDVPAASVSLFNINNIVHDYLYGIGFNEAMWNFQQDNFGKGGAGADAVRAETMDFSGTNNANFGTSAEGSPPRMQMYLFGETVFRRSDGSFDWDVIAHEYYHGVSNRSAAKGATGCLGVTLVGESGGQGEGWSDFFATSLSDDDAEGEFVTGQLDVGIRRLPYNNYRWSYGTVNDQTFRRRDGGVPDDKRATVPFEVHDVGEVFAAMLWDMRELLIMKDPNGVFFDGSRRLGSSTKYYIGDRQVSSVDAAHPIDYRASFNTTGQGVILVSNGATGISSPTPAPDTAVPTINDQHAIRPGLVAAEIKSRGDRKGPLATAVSKGAKLADTLVLRGLQLSPCNPSIVDTRNSILLADQQMNGGENRAVIWRAFASHGAGTAAVSTSQGNQAATQNTPQVVEDFTVPAGVAACETSGPLPSPVVTAVNDKDNTVTLTLPAVTGTSKFYISRATAAAGPFAPIATVTAAASGSTTYADNDNGSGLSNGRTYFYKVRASRDADGNCVSQAKDADVKAVTITKGAVVLSNPVFPGVAAVSDPLACNVLNVSWSPARSDSTTAKLVYDVYRVTSTATTNGTVEPTFTPVATGTGKNLVQEGLTSTSFIDKGLTRNQPYYYIVRARDADNGRIDTANAGNLVVKYGAPSSPTVTATPPFAKETYEAAPATGRFIPSLVDSGATPNQGVPNWQRVSNYDLGGGVKSSVMYAPDYDAAMNQAGNSMGGQPSDFSTVIGPLTITPDSVLNFDSKINSEASFDGGVVEISFLPTFNATPFPDNTTTFDLGDYMTQGGYNGKLDGQLEGATQGSPLRGRRAFTGDRGLTHTTIPLKAFATGGAHPTNSGSVYIRFRMTSDAGSTAGPGAGWFVDNLSVTNYADCPANQAPLAVLNVTPSSGSAPLTTLLSGAGSSDPDALTNGDTVASYTFDFGDGSATVTQTGSEISHTYATVGTYTAKLTVADRAGLASPAVTKAVTVTGGSTPGPVPTISDAPGAPAPTGRFGGALGLPLLAGLLLLGRRRRR